MAAPIRFYFDFASPYAWFALPGLARLATMYGRDIDLRPMLLWAVFKAQNIPPPLDVPARRAYLVADMVRSAEFHGVPFTLPAQLGISTHLAARLFYAHVRQAPEDARNLAHALLHAHMVEGRSLADETVLISCAAPFGMSAADTRAAVSDPQAKHCLSEAVDAAVAAGVCGSPYFVVDGEGFFGADRLPQIAWRLARPSCVSPA
ncbi:2-hydroxychromene-2-carboxylate isomerase [Azorhizobium oxalatiphilum]|uniref:2-hydroxychromene-2-carboxylate isomerase n=1 Tax=Azorhizobium oxalatiphilum TaxID=980631 RepID=A0A917BQ80_9HYPH|nr:DsbA family protein [Azorhizobium oxalatiphilum]GGF52414.1 2-hydroxychromene-2-carboxylate isomerase [Azorhizobium oxalatiphilum]